MINIVQHNTLITSIVSFLSQGHVFSHIKLKYCEIKLQTSMDLVYTLWPLCLTLRSFCELYGSNYAVYSSFQSTLWPFCPTLWSFCTLYGNFVNSMDLICSLQQFLVNSMALLPNSVVILYTLWSFSELYGSNMQSTAVFSRLYGPFAQLYVHLVHSMVIL